jgi:hypothetical protein
LFATVISGISSANLTPASGRQDHTASPSASAPFVIGTIRVHRIPPRVRDDREPPLQWDETARDMQVIWVRRERKYFLMEHWTTQITLMALAFLLSTRMALKAFSSGVDTGSLTVLLPYQLFRESTGSGIKATNAFV